MPYFRTPISGDRLKVGWNINSAHSQFISGLLIKANRLHLEGQFHDWYWHLSALRDNINHELNELERGELNLMERIIDRSYEHSRRTKLNSDKFNYHNNIRKYEWKLLDLMKKLGYLPSKEDKTTVHL